MGKWNKTGNHFGEIGPNTVNSATFTFVKDNPEDIYKPVRSKYGRTLKIVKSCTCIQVAYDEKTNTLTGILRPGAFPPHLLQRGQRTMNLIRTFTFEYIDGPFKKNQTFSLQATVKV